jgi:hypothetical protein
MAVCDHRARRFHNVSDQYGGPAAPGPPPPDDNLGTHRPGPYLAPGGYGSGGFRAPVARPREVIVSAVIAFALGGLCALISIVVLLTPSGADVSQTLTGKDGSQGVVGFALLVSVALYVVPAVFVLQRRPWARILMIAVAGLGITGGVMSLPGGILGLAVHVVLLVSMLKPTTRAWFGVR